MKFFELSKEAKDRHRYYVAEHWMHNNWSDGVISDAKDAGMNQGFRISAVFFSGFWSQGDGASWKGEVDVEEWLEYHYKNTEDIKYLMLMELCKNGNVTGMRINQNSNHDASMSIGYYAEIECFDEEKLWQGIMFGANVLELREILCSGTWMIDVNEEILESAKDYANQIYKNLEVEYNYQLSDEYLSEECDVNEREFTEKGELL